MIGVRAAESDLPFVEELFELFKTPWEPAIHGQRYDVLLSTDGLAIEALATLTLIYGSSEVPYDRQAGMTVTAAAGPVAVTSGANTFPIYGTIATFAGPRHPGTLRALSGAVDYRVETAAGTVHRVGCDLFREVRFLLTRGQPTAWALTPTLELHIAWLRRCIEASGIPYVEIPPRPDGADFACCLTHDVDFFGIRRHVADRTLAGFLVRGTVGTVIDVIRGRRPLGEAARNLLAVLSLPLVLLGIRRDFWQPIEDYAHADRGLPATFFIVPFKDHAGVSPDGPTRSGRAIKYGARDIGTELRAAGSTGSVEFALHGLDAWRDAAAGRAEMRELASSADGAVAGVRMHWLYFSADSPRHLEHAGFAYDSTCGYNDAIGYRAGTMQAFRLPGCDALLELPLAVMDTAMFYPDRMGLDRPSAFERCRAIVDDASRFGGALVVNWHDRSLAPERQWHQAYDRLLDELQTRPVWFATAGAVAEWFRWRRSINLTAGPAGEVVIDGPPPPDGARGARLVVRRSGDGAAPVEEMAFNGVPVALTP